MRFVEAYGGWQEHRLTQEAAARLLGVCERTACPVKAGVPALRGPLRRSAWTGSERAKSAGSKHPAQGIIVTFDPDKQAQRQKLEQ